MADTSSLRQRKTAPSEKPSSEIDDARKRAKEEDEPTLWLDILRVIAFLFLASCGLSYLISGGETFFWGMKNKPNYMRVDWWKSHFQPPLELTIEELAAFDGTDASKPIYLAINGTIYDVTPGRRIYGPGGSYHWFAGCDASRAYVTGCFADDRTADMRGAEEMFLPIEDPEINALYTKDELREIRRQELKEARQKVQEALKHWVDFFAKSDKYHKVGTVKREKGWLKNEPRRELCEAAQQGRVKRKAPERGEKKKEGEQQT
ncbi:hypothetical protein jhhlp_001069 [Lomentospora prolificans]|uniref:Cytochrome b5 heme-binding domain-containing protein n=1 Tax=Lomentospora prolificans TaxID=41688 RepID=A0A2N3NH29_9PEZI|nr:hypothetical protein jhhlp_001069 [Lomentospora prolificans]